MNTRMINPIPRMRTIREAAAEMKSLDSQTAVTEYHIRQLALSGILPCVKAGRKLLINFDTLLEYMSNPTAERFQNPDPDTGKIRKIV